MNLTNDVNQHAPIHIEGTYADAVIYADTIDTGAMGLLKALCASPAAQGSKIRVMPDVHAGKGCAIGTTMTLTDRVSPGLVGVDMGCGMTALKVSGKRIELQKLDKLIREKIPTGRAIRNTCHRFADEIDLDRLLCLRHVQKDKALRSLGTLGSGNHFIELDREDDGSCWLIIHSGSRHLGGEVAAHYHNAAASQCPQDIPYELAYAQGELMEQYLHDLAIVQEFAELNRRSMAAEIVKGMKWDIVDSFSSVHNYIDRENMILRKGAVSAKAGERLIIPMNMRDGCLLCLGRGNEDWNQSAPHGAGRLMSRSEARQSLTLSQYKREMQGVYTSSISKDTLDESPMAYKPMARILEQIAPTAEVIAQLHPVYNCKAAEVGR